MNSYDEQCFKWAKAKFPEHDFDAASVHLDVNVYEGCPTCGPETEINIGVHLRKDVRIVAVETIKVDYGTGFPEILKEIIEA